MNFKLFLIFTCLIASGCGVKAKPSSPSEKAISSYVESYTETRFEDNKENKKKN